MFERNALIELRQWAAWPGYKPMVSEVPVRLEKLRSWISLPQNTMYI